MNEPTDLARQVVDRQAAQWLASGPDRAPEGLLAAAMDSTVRARQRPALLAVVLGAPDLGRPTRTFTWTRLLMLVALAALAAVAVMALVGGPSPDVLVVAPSTSPSRSSTPESASPQPTGITRCMFAPELPCTPSVRDVLDLTIGFAFDGGSEWSNLPADNTMSRRFGHGKCWDGICNKGYVTVAAFPVDEGFTVFADPVEAGAPAMRISGTTLAKLERAWLAAYPDSVSAATEVGGVPAIVVRTPSNLYVLAINEDRIYGFMSAGPAFIGQSPPSSLARDANLTAFLNGFHFLALLEPSPVAEGQSGTVGDLEVTAPAGWTVVENASSLSVSQGIGILAFAIVQRVSVLEPGQDLSIARTGSTSGASFTIGGSTFNELVAAIDRGLGDAERFDAVIAGQAGYRWAVPQRSVQGPLAMMAALEWNGRFYVFEVHYPLDGAPLDTLGPLLAGVALH